MQDDANFGRVCNYAGLHDDGELSMVFHFLRVFCVLHSQLFPPETLAFGGGAVCFCKFNSCPHP